jgi:hypothetical protein
MDEYFLPSPSHVMPFLYIAYATTALEDNEPFLWGDLVMKFACFFYQDLLTATSYCTGCYPPCSACAPEWLQLIAGVAPWSTDLCLYIAVLALLGALLFLLMAATLCRMLLGQVILIQVLQNCILYYRFMQHIVGCLFWWFYHLLFDWIAPLM